MINTGIGLGLGALNFFNGQQALRNQEEAMELAEQQARANFANNAKLINNRYDSDARIAASMEGSIGRNGSVGLTSQAVRNARMDEANKRHVSGTF